MKSKNFKILILFTIGVVFVSNNVQAQISPPPPPPGLPIDMGVVGLVIAAIGLGVTKLKKQI